MIFTIIRSLIHWIDLYHNLANNNGWKLNGPDYGWQWARRGTGFFLHIPVAVKLLPPCHHSYPKLSLILKISFRNPVHLGQIPAVILEKLAHFMAISILLMGQTNLFGLESVIFEPSPAQPKACKINVYINYLLCFASSRLRPLVFDGYCLLVSNT